MLHKFVISGRSNGYDQSNFNRYIVVLETYCFSSFKLNVENVVFLYIKKIKIKIIIILNDEKKNQHFIDAIYAL